MLCSDLPATHDRWIAAAPDFRARRAAVAREPVRGGGRAAVHRSARNRRAPRARAGGQWGWPEPAIACRALAAERVVAGRLAIAIRCPDRRDAARPRRDDQRWLL